MTVLVVVGQGLGNIVMATPAVAAVSTMAREVHVSVYSSCPSAHTVLEGWNAVKKVCANGKDTRAKYDATVVTWGNDLNFAKYGIVYRPDTKKPVDVHESMVHMEPVYKMGYFGPIPETHVEGDVEWAKQEYGYDYIAVCPGFGGVKRAQWFRKRWPRWDKLIRGFSPLPYVVIGGTKDYGEIPKLPNAVNRIGKTTLRQAVGLLANAKAVVSCDNGLAHAAGALGVPTVVLFGATSHVKNRPLGHNVTLVCSGLECAPCQYTPRWELCENWSCMKDISVDRVVGELKRILGV